MTVAASRWGPFFICKCLSNTLVGRPVDISQVAERSKHHELGFGLSLVGSNYGRCDSARVWEWQ